MVVVVRNLFRSIYIALNKIIIILICNRIFNQTRGYRGFGKRGGMRSKTSTHILIQFFQLSSSLNRVLISSMYFDSGKYFVNFFEKTVRGGL